LPNGNIFSHLKFHGNTKWLPVGLVWLALCWAWSESRNLTDAFTEAYVISFKLFPQQNHLSTYQGFMGAMVTWTSPFIPLLRDVLHQRMQQLGGPCWKIAGWVPIAFDGSRSSVPRTPSNEAAYCAANYGQGKTAKYRKKKSKGMRRQKNEKNPGQPPEPQAWITLLWHMGFHLPWSWRLGPSNSSERDHVMQLVSTEPFPKSTLFCGDAGFIGYLLWAGILGRGHDFLVRVGANVHLLFEHADCDFKQRGKDFEVLCWPRTAIRSQQPPLHLRLLQVKLGRTTMWLLTSVLDHQRLTAVMAARFYEMRWGIEVEFRGLKQTLERAHLRSRNSHRLFAELDWAILAMAIAELFATKEQQTQSENNSRDKHPAKQRGKNKTGMMFDPVKRSLANTMRALRNCLRHLHEVPAEGQDIMNRLRRAVTDDYQRKSSKQARYRPPNPDKQPLGAPHVRQINAKQRKQLTLIAQNTAA
jgi:Transposase DDE domain